MSSAAIPTPTPCYALKKTNRALCLRPVRPSFHTCGVHGSQESSVAESISFQTSDPPTVDSLYPQCEAITYKRWHLRCNHVARHGFQTCAKHTTLEAGIVSRKVAAAAAAAERDALEAQYKAAGHHVILCDGFCVPQDEEYAIKSTLEVEEIECLQFHKKAVLYGYRSYDSTKKKHVLYVAETPEDAKELALAIQEGNWYRTALFQSEKTADSE